MSISDVRPTPFTADWTAYRGEGAPFIRTVADKLGESLSVQDFGAVGDGVTDDTAAILAAVAEAQSRVAGRFTGPGVAVYFPPGTYLVSGTITISTSNVYLVGAAAGASMLYAPSATFDLIHFDGSALALYSVGVRDLKTYTPGNATAGAHLRMRRCINAMVSGFQAVGWFDGIVSDGCAKTVFSSVLLTQENRTNGTTLRYGLHFKTTAENNSDVHVSDFNIVFDPDNQTATDTVLIDGADGIYLANGHLFGRVRFNPAGGACASVTWANVYFDRSTAGANVEFNGTATAYRNHWFVGCYFRESGGSAIEFDAAVTISMVSVIGGKVSGHQAFGVRCVTAVDGLILSGVLFDGNNIGNAAGVGDVRLLGKASVIGCRFSGGGAAGTALAVVAGSDNTIVACNSLGQSTAGTRITDAGTGTRIRGNIGFAQKSAGQATIANPATTSVVNHGLAVTPSIAHITLTLNSDSAGVTRFWVSNVTATQFTINLNATPTTSAAIGWKVDSET